VVWSMLMFIGGAVIAYITLNLQNITILEQIPIVYDETGTHKFNVFEAALVIGLVFISILALFSIWGCINTCLTTKWCLCPFSFLLFIVSIPFLVVGVIFVIQVASENFLIKGCELSNNNRFDEMNYEMEKTLFRQIKSFDDQIGEILNPNMCSQQCPCLKSSTAYATYNSLTEAEL
jgi:hypothetical protein